MPIDDGLLEAAQAYLSGRCSDPEPALTWQDKLAATVVGAAREEGWKAKAQTVKRRK
jgi:hypothetical protein